MHAIYTLKQTLNNERVTSNKTQLRRQNRTLSNTELKKSPHWWVGGVWKRATGQTERAPVAKVQIFEQEK